MSRLGDWTGIGLEDMELPVRQDGKTFQLAASIVIPQSHTRE